MRSPRTRGWWLPVLLLVSGLLPALAWGQSRAREPEASTAPAGAYLLGPEDVLQISVYLHPELERTTTVDANGNITFPPIGEIKADGLTAKQLGDRIADKLSAYLRQTTAVTVTVAQYMSRSVFVSGAVAKPGRYGFEVIPGLVEVIGQAGGAIAGADLARVQIVRREGAQRRTLYADVGSTLRDGDTSRLPSLRPGDTVIIPPGIGMGQFSAAGGGAGVIGEVGKPGLYAVGEGQDVWTLLAVAGGPTRESRLSDVRVITREGAGVSVIRLDLKEMLGRGTRQTYVVKDGDVIYVPQNSASRWGSVLTGLGAVTRIATDIFQIMVLQQVLEDSQKNP